MAIKMVLRVWGFEGYLAGVRGPLAPGMKTYLFGGVGGRSPPHVFINAVMHRRSVGKNSDGAQQWRSQDFG